MIYHYVVTLKNQQSRYLDWLGFLLSGVSVLFFVMELVQSKTVGFAYLAGAIFITILLAWNVYQTRFNKRKVHYSRALLIAGLVWMKMPYFQWLFFVFLILGLLEYQAKYSVEIGFDAKEIVINSFPKRRYNWSHFNNIVLKDGVLTLDFCSNKLWQKETLGDEDDDVEEDEFNQFCATHISIAKNTPAVME